MSHMNDVPFVHFLQTPSQHAQQSSGSAFVDATAATTAL
jgi:hypothetical protein